MPLFLFAIAGAPLCLAMLWTHARFAELERWQSAAIALDNTSILLGRSAREMWNELHTIELKMKAVDRQHHYWHACARVPATATKCALADQTLEARLAAQQVRAWVLAQKLWSEGLIAARAEAARWKIAVRFTRALSPPLRPLKCPVCGAPLGWRLLGSSQEHAQLERPPRLRNRVEWVPGLRWNYAVREEEN